MINVKQYPKSSIIEEVNINGRAFRILQYAVDTEFLSTHEEWLRNPVEAVKEHSEEKDLMLKLFFLMLWTLSTKLKYTIKWSNFRKKSWVFWISGCKSRK